MNYDIILIRYGELSLKSVYVRKHFESQLVQNIKKALIKEDIPHQIRVERGRIYLSTTEISKSISCLPRIFGIVSFSPAIQTTSSIQDISIIAQRLTNNILTKQKSFALRVTRIGTHPFSSQDVAVQVGNDIVQATHARVDLTNPDIELFIEIRDKKSFLFTDKIPGVGGLPLGTQGRILALVENSSSLLSAWYLMRRGCNVIIVNTIQSYEEGIRKFFSQWYTDIEIISINKTGNDFSNRLCAIASENHCNAIVTNHILEEPVPSISSMKQLKENCDLPLLCPLIAMTQKEIENQCQTRGIKL